MKYLKIVSAILICFLVTTCSNNNIGSSTTDLIIGIWKPIKEVGVCQDNSLQIDEYSTCEQNNDKLTFNANGLFNWVYFDENNGVCTQIGEYSGTWEINNGDLFLTENGLTDMVTFFEITNNTLRLGDVEEDPFDDPCSSTVGLSHYYTEFNRVE
jgi:Lipocalin-like domain